MRTVGPYILAPEGWRRMNWEEALHARLDADYRDIMDRRNPLLARFEARGTR